jgi:hypothetical protein
MKRKRIGRAAGRAATRMTTTTMIGLAGVNRHGNETRTSDRVRAPVAAVTMRKRTTDRAGPGPAMTKRKTIDRAVEVEIAMRMRTTMTIGHARRSGAAKMTMTTNRSRRGRIPSSAWLESGFCFC